MTKVRNAKVHMDLVRNGFSPRWISSEMDIFRYGNSPTSVRDCEYAVRDGHYAVRDCQYAV